MEPTISNFRDSLYRQAARAVHAAEVENYSVEVRCKVDAPGPLGVCTVCEQRATVAVDAGVVGLSEELARLHTWAGLMELLDEHWPATVFPTLAYDNDQRDAGARIVSLIRHLADVNEENLRLSAEVESLQQAADEVPPANYVG